MWITWSPIATLVAAMWDESVDAVDALSGIYMYIYVIGSFLSLYLVVNHIGLYRGLVVGGIFNFVGAFIRYFYLENYRSVYIGTVFCAIAQTFTLSTPPLIAGSWFGASERATATALGVMANQLGTMLGMGSTVLVNFEGDDNHIHIGTLKCYMGLQLLVATLAVLLVLVFGADQPKTPPRKTAAACFCPSKLLLLEQTPLLPSSSHSVIKTNTEGRCVMGYVESFKLVLSDAKHVAFVVSFGMSVGVYYTIPTFLSQLLPSHWPLRWSGWLGVAYQFAGLVGSFGSGLVVDRTGQLRWVCQVLLQCSALFLFLLLIVLTTVPMNEAAMVARDAGIIVGVAFTGMVLAAWNAMGLEFGAAVTYPGNEAAVAGMLECAAELLGFVWVTIGGHVMMTADDQDAKLLVVGVLFLAIFASMLIFLCTPLKSQRPFDF